MNHLTGTKINVVLLEKGSKVSKALVKATGGLTSLVALTDILMENGLLSKKTQTRWFASSYGKSFEAFCEETGVPHIKLPTNAKVVDLKLTSKEGGNYLPKQTIMGFLDVIQNSENQEQLRAVLMGKEQIEGVHCPIEFKSLESLRSGFVKYFGMPLGSWEKLSTVNKDDVPDFLTLKTSKTFFKTYIDSPKSWREIFYCEKFGFSDEMYAIIKSDSEDQRQKGEFELISLFKGE